MREAFIPRNSDFELLAADYSQIELRIMASLSGDESMLKSFNNGEDIHKSTASKVYKIGEEEVTREMRSHAKMVNFASYLKPINYDRGIKYEYESVRNDVGIFDVSHMGQFFLEGDETLIESLEKIIPAD